MPMAEQTPREIPLRLRRGRLLAAAAPLATAAALVAGCGSNVGGSSQSVMSGNKAEGQSVFTAGPEPGDAFGPSSSPAPPSEGSGSGKATKIEVADVGSLGQVLVSSSGRTVYLFTSDRDGGSTCHDACAKTWKPVTTSGTPQAGKKVNDSRLGTTTRKGGATQVTYAGHPLYYYAPEQSGPSSATGQGLRQFGGEWYAVSPQGGKAERGGS
jgi:predicted lipoprotein with Yx(FWY)xxD motif